MLGEIIKYLQKDKILEMQLVCKRFYTSIVPELFNREFGGVIRSKNYPELTHVAVCQVKGNTVGQVVFNFDDGSRNVYGSGGGLSKPDIW